MEKSQKLRRRVKGAMSYPLIVLFIAGLVVVVLLTKVIPVFEKMFKDFGGGKLPAPTQFVIDLSFALRHYLPYFVVGLIPARHRVEVGPAHRQRQAGLGRHDAQASDFRHGVAQDRGGSLHPHHGHPVVVGGSHSRRHGNLGKTAGNVVVQEGIMFVRARISEGKDMSTPLMETGLMPPMVVQMISVGEQTGALDAMLTKIADFYEEEVDVAVASMTSLIEPLLMVFLGTVVGGLVIAMYLPIFEMAGNIKSG